MIQEKIVVDLVGQGYFGHVMYKRKGKLVISLSSAKTEVRFPNKWRQSVPLSLISRQNYKQAEGRQARFNAVKYLSSPAGLLDVATVRIR